MDSFFTMFLATFLGQGLVRILCYLIDAIKEYYTLCKAHACDTSSDKLQPKG